MLDEDASDIRLKLRLAARDLVGSGSLDARLRKASWHINSLAMMTFLLMSGGAPRSYAIDSLVTTDFYRQTLRQ
jgi:hypothetical protein